MSDPRRLPTAESAPKCAGSLRIGHAARFLHELPIVVRLAVPLLASGCVLPPSLSIDEGAAAVNSPPVLRDVRDEVGNTFARPGPRTLTVGEGRLVITASDADLGDTLYVRYYLDYGLAGPTTARITCPAAPGAMPTLERQVTCSLVGVCQDGDVGSTEHIFEIDVYDREPQDDGENLYRDVSPPGEYTTWWWKVTCAGGGS